MDAGRKAVSTTREALTVLARPQYTNTSDQDTFSDEVPSCGTIDQSVTNSRTLSSDDLSLDEEDGEENEEGEIRKFRRRSRSQHYEVTEYDSSILRDVFRAKLKAKETPSDLGLLYPPSLWKDSNQLLLKNTLNDRRRAYNSVTLEHGWRELTMVDFSVYNTLSHRKFPGQFESLHTVASEQEKTAFLLDGICIASGHTIVLEGAEISQVSIGALESDYHSCKDQIWIQTIESVESNVWFRLATPSASYEPIWSDFYWIANFVKYCVDYLMVAEHSNRLVNLDDFRAKFIVAIIELHGHDESFLKWRQGSEYMDDFRRHVSQLHWFVYDQCHSAGLSNNLQCHPLWHDVGYFLPKHNTTEKNKHAVTDERTIVTDNIAHAFLNTFSQWGPRHYDLLLRQSCDAVVEAHRLERSKLLHLPNKLLFPQNDNFRSSKHIRESKVEWTLREASVENRSTRCLPEHLCHKLVVVRQHGNTKEHFDFALVTSIMPNKKRARVMWLTLPSDTICANPTDSSEVKYPKEDHEKAFYPIGNELFISDDCNCFSVRISDIVGVYTISVLDDYKGQPCEFFAISQYIRRDQCFIRPEQSRLSFSCHPMCEVRSSVHSKPHDSVTPRRRCKRNSGSPGSGWSLHTPGFTSPQPLDNLSLFSGCGLFDRALESGGALHTVLSIDMDGPAICSAKANKHSIPGEKDTEYVVESVNPELLKVMNGERAYPQLGCMSAGCPCPGFSSANTHKMSKNGQKQCTLLASTLSWVEVTLPAFVVIENVPAMDSSSLACSQAISCLMSFGYQVRKCILKASEFGGCTKRTRLFIIAAAPAFKLPDCPAPTHGITGSNLQQLIKFKEAVSDLDPVHNDLLFNVSTPYHVPVERLSANIMTNDPNFRDVMHRILPGNGVTSSRDLMTRSQRVWIDSLSEMKKLKNSKTMMRVDAENLLPTVLTRVNWRCAMLGQCLHYDQDRLLTLEESARGQGVPRDYVFIGSSAQMLRQVGNAVPWCLREAIGKEIFKAYSQSGAQTMTSAGIVDNSNEKSPVLSKGAVLKDDDDKMIPSTEAEHVRALRRRTASATSVLSSPQDRLPCHNPEFQSVIGQAVSQRSAEHSTRQNDTVQARTATRRSVETKRKATEVLQLGDTNDEDEDDIVDLKRAKRWRGNHQ